MLKILIKSGQLVQVSSYNFLFFNHDNINVGYHFTGFYLFVSYYTSLLFDFFSLGLQNHLRMPMIITFRIISS